MGEEHSIATRFPLIFLHVNKGNDRAAHGVVQNKWDDKHQAFRPLSGTQQTLSNVTILHFAVTFLGLTFETQGERSTWLSSATYLTSLGLRLLILALGTAMTPKGLFEIRVDQAARAGGPGNNTDVC